MLDIEPAQTPLPDKEWHKHLEGMLTHGKLNPDILPYLDHKQQYVINEIKKTIKRIDYRNENHQH